MDNKKDIAGNIENKSIQIKDSSSFSVFLIKKTEKLSAAVFLVTDFMDDQDPLRIGLRSAVLKALSSLLSRDDRSEALALESARTLLSLFQVASYARLISDMNWQIFKSELESLIAQIESGSGRSRDALLSAVFFQASLPEQSAAEPADQGSGYKGHNHNRHMSDIKDNRMSFRTASNAKIFESKALIGDFAKTNRKEEILAFFRKGRKSGISIKDISAVMKDCSEKTIQRELIALVQKGLLRKEGERRWSRYSLAG